MAKDTGGTELQSRQMEFDFDYEGNGLSTATRNALEKHADQIRHYHDEGRLDSITAAMAIASEIAAAKKHFKGLDEPKEGTWAEWCKGRLGMSRSAADKAVQVHKAFGRISVQNLAGLPASRLYRLAQEKTPQDVRKRVLALAKENWLSEADVDQHLDAGQNGASFNVSTPKTHEELKEYLGKKINGTKKRIDAELGDELPDVLRELADELEEGEDGSD